MKKRFLAVFIVCAMVIGTVGCKKAENPEVFTTTPTPAQTVTDAGTATDDKVPVNDDSSFADNIAEPSGNNNSSDSNESSDSINESSDNSTVSENNDIVYSKDGPDTPGFISLLTHPEKFWGTYDDNKYEYQSYTSGARIRLTEEDAITYPQLAKALEKYSDDIINGSINECEFLQSEIDEYFAEYNTEGDEECNPFLPWYSNTTLQPVRSDSSVVSFLTCNDSYTGGVHGYYGVGGNNYDTRTGKEIRLADVIWPEKFDFLANYIKERLELNNPEEGYWYDNYEVVQSMQDGTINWVIDYDGITFYWNPYVVASYATGIVSYKVLFTEVSEIFTGKYISAPSNYIIPITFGDYYTDLDGDGYADFIYVGTDSFNEYGDFHSLRIVTTSLDDEGKMLYKTFTDDDVYGFTGDSYFIKAGDTKLIYFFLLQESDDAVLCVYKYGPDGFELVNNQLGYSLAGTRFYYGDGEYDYDYYDTVFSPLDLQLNTRHDVFGTTFEQGSYILDQNGLPKLCSDFLILLGSYWTTILKEFDFDRTDAVDTAISGKVTIPAGTKMKFYRTDCNGRVDFTTEDGTCVAVNLEQNFYINGESIYDLFDYIFAAD